MSQMKIRITASDIQSWRLAIVNAETGELLPVLNTDEIVITCPEFGTHNPITARVTLRVDELDIMAMVKE